MEEEDLVRSLEELNIISTNSTLDDGSPNSTIELFVFGQQGKVTSL
jgi:hypothetical protein